MEKLKSEALQFIERLQTLYFEERNLSALLPAMMEDTSWIGTGAQELCRNLDDAKIALTLEAQEVNVHFTIVQANYDVTCISEDTCVVYGEIIARPDVPEIANLYHRFTVVCVRTDEGMKLKHLHMSAPDADQEEGRFYISRAESGQRETLRLRAEKIARELRERNNELEALTENIPGGVHQCEYNSDMIFLSMSKSFQTLVGYSQKEIQQRFHNCFAEMVYPADLPRIQAEMAEQLSHSDTLELEYRILRKDGKLLWILDQGKRASLADGSRCFYCVLMDITRQKEQREELRLSLERHQIIMNQTTDIIFEWDIALDALTFSSNWRKKFGYDAIRSTISQKIPKSHNIHPDDMSAFIKIMEDSAIGVPYSETEFRIRDVSGDFRWHRIRATVQFDSQHRPVKAIGVILDIDADKKQKESLLEQAQRDSLTNLYNKAAVCELVTQQMQESSGVSNQTLLIIDVDNFKNVNDTYGHLCGDTLLTDVAGVLKNYFHTHNIVGRIGGDEFLVYLPAVAEKKEAIKEVQGLLMLLGGLKPRRDALPISCSIGAAFFPQKTADFFTLYKCADMALYQIKAHGKNNFAFYDPESNGDSLIDDLTGSAVGGIESDAENLSDAVGDKLAQYTFRMLYDSNDIHTALEQLLEIIGRAYEMSRVYICESSKDEEKCSITFAWYNVGIHSKIDRIVNTHENNWERYAQKFHENKFFYCQDVSDLHPDVCTIMESQEICSMLQFAIVDDGVYKGFISFDECRKSRSWTKAQIASLTLIANILSTFLLKLRLKEELHRSHDS